MRRACRHNITARPCRARGGGCGRAHVIRGAGFGHGIGLSQYGAYGYALHGRSYQAILAHYYKGTRLSTAPSRPVRVLLQPEDPYIRVSGATAHRRAHR